jgi:hypothetical protein
MKKKALKRGKVFAFLINKKEASNTTKSARKADKKVVKAIYE